jgi:hypothetical protein
MLVSHAEGIHLLFHALLPSNVKLWNDTLCSDVLTALTSWCALIAAAFDLAFAAIEACRLFGAHI